MSPHALTDGPAAADELPAATWPGRTCPPRPRLTVREMQIALDAARGLAGAAPTRTVTDRSEKVGADRSHAAPGHDAVEGRSSVTAPNVTATRPAAPPTQAPSAAPPRNPEPWLPEHDGPVSLTGVVAAPRTRTVRHAAAARPDKVARRPAAKPRPRRLAKVAAIGAELAAAVAADPPRIVVVAACGGAGATTTAVLLAAGLAPACGAILLAAGPDRGSLTLRCNAEGGDLEMLTGWARHHPRQPLQIDTPGMAIGTSGQHRLLVAADRRRHQQGPLTAGAAAALLPAAAATRAAVVLDWCTREPVPGRVWDTAPRAVVVAPMSSAGLLDAEYTVEQIEAARPVHATVSLLTIDVRGRAPRRAGRAALARLRALPIPTAGVPYDPALADDPRIHWPCLRPRTRAAIFTALTQLLQREDEK
jgi:hypothetical protein